MRLDPRRRYAWYFVATLLVTTGVVWLVADQLKAGDDAELWQKISATTLMIHGGVAMLALLLMGSLYDSHILRAWRSKSNRATGSVMVLVNAILVVTAFGLYYSGSEVIRGWISLTHIALGIFMPAMIILHVWYGRHLRAKRGMD